MAFIQKGLFRVSPVGSVGIGPDSVKSLYMYATADDAATVETAGYFNAQATELKVGDLMLASMGIGATPAAKSYVVSANTGTVVTIVAGTL